MRTLATVGGQLPNGDTVLSLFRQAIDNEGRWLAYARGQTGSSLRGTLLVNGEARMTEGDVLVDGSKLITIESIYMGPNGAPAVWYRIEDPANPTQTLDRIALDGTVVFAEGQSILIPSLGISGVVGGINGFSWRGDEAYVSFFYRTQSGTVRRALVDFQLVGTSLIAVDGFVSDDSIPGGGGTFFSGAPELAMIEGGVTGGRVTMLKNGGLSGAIEVDGSIVAEVGEPAPLAGSTWDGFLGATISVLANGSYALAAVLAPASGPSERVIVRDGTLWRRRGDLIGGSVAHEISLIGDVARISSVGEAFFYARIVGVGFVLAVEQEVLLEPGTPVAGGDTVLAVAAYFPSQAVSPDGRLVLASATLSSTGTGLQLIERRNSEPTGCLANVNSTGVPGSIVASGSRFVGVNQLAIVAEGLPPHAAGFLLAARNDGFVANPGGSSGNLCLSGPVGRFSLQAQSSGVTGTISTTIDLSALPQPNGAVGAQPGERWFFQLWHRDTNGGVITSNFTDSVAITFL